MQYIIISIFCQEYTLYFQTWISMYKPQWSDKNFVRPSIQFQSHLLFLWHCICRLCLWLWKTTQARRRTFFLLHFPRVCAYLWNFFYISFCPWDFSSCIEVLVMLNILKISFVSESENQVEKKRKNVQNCVSAIMKLVYLSFTLKIISGTIPSLELSLSK